MSTNDENLYRGDPPRRPRSRRPTAPRPATDPRRATPRRPGYGPPPGYGYPSAYGRPTNTMAILAWCWRSSSRPAGLILGIVARKQIRQTGEDGDGLALAGIIVGGIFTAIFVLLIVFWIIAVASLANGSFGP